MNAIIIPNLIAFIAVAFQLVTIIFSIYITRRVGFGYLNGINLAMAVALARRTADYLTTFDTFSMYAKHVQYVEIVYLPIIFSICMLLGLLQMSNLYRLHRLSEGKLREDLYD